MAQDIRELKGRKARVQASSSLERESGEGLEVRAGREERWQLHVSRK